MKRKTLLILACTFVISGCIRKDDLTWVKEAVQKSNSSEVTIAQEEGIIKTGNGEETVDKTTTVWTGNEGYEKMDYIGTSNTMYVYYKKVGEKIKSYNGLIDDESGKIKYSEGQEFDEDEFKIACRLDIKDDAKLKHEGVRKEDGIECIKIRVKEKMKQSYSDKMIKQGLINKKEMEKDPEAKKILDKGYSDQKEYYIWLKAETHELYKKQEDSTIPLQLTYYAAKTSGAGEVMDFPESAVYITKYEHNKEYEKIEAP